MNTLQPRTALVSVSDKTDLVPFVHELVQLGCRIISTGGTAAALHAADIKVQEISDYTQTPEMFAGRVKSIHPMIAGGILARRDHDDAEMSRYEIAPIDLVVVNLYPFEATIADPATSEADVIENIDIGGPSLIRSAAKNHHDVLVLVDPADYTELIERWRNTQLDQAYRQQLAAKAFRHTAAYDALIANHFSADSMPEKLTMTFKKEAELRYGENPHQAAAFYVSHPPQTGTVATRRQYQGKQLSFNNIADADAAINCVSSFDQTACVIVKHANPCGVAVDENLTQTYRRAFACDPTSAFGGVIAFNRELDQRTVETIIDNQFVDVLIAPSVSKGAIEATKRRKQLRLIAVGDLLAADQTALDFKQVSGGLLVQTRDVIATDLVDYEVVSDRQPTDQEMTDLVFAWQVVMHVKSNAIVFANERRTVGIGAGQMNRVLSARIAQLRATEEKLLSDNVVMASDAFFPFRDSIDNVAEAGITAVIQPGGSIRDDEVIAAVNEHGMAMILTGIRHFKH